MTQKSKFSLKFRAIIIMMASIFLCLTLYVPAQHMSAGNFYMPLTNVFDTIPAKDSLQKPVLKDTIPLTDSVKLLATDTIPHIDSFDLRLSKDTLDGPLKFYAKDSAVIKVKEEQVYLYGSTKTDYESGSSKIELTAPLLTIDQRKNLISAQETRDSSGNLLEEVKFTQGEESVVSKEMHFNIKTGKGLTVNAITQSGEMFVHGEVVKRVNDSVMYAGHGFFTTCNLDEPHFGFRSNKMKVVNKKVAVSGPVHPEFENVPVPVYLPFGYFPLSQGRKSGMLPISFETNDLAGLGLTNIGYYKVINDHWDAKLYGNVYSYGSWQANLAPTYRKRYKYSGSFNLGWVHTRRAFKGDPDYYTDNSYSINWNHSSDNRARPGTSFSANVRASSTGLGRNLPNRPDMNFATNMGSSITYSKTWEGKPFNLTASANHNQNNTTRLVSVALPDVTFSMNTIYPFQKKEMVGSKKWYEQLGIGYNGSFKNQISFYDTAFKLRNLIDTAQWGAQHNIPIAVSLPAILGGAVIISPSISYSQVWIQQSRRLSWNAAEEKVDTSYSRGFNIDQQMAFGLGFNTSLYGTYVMKNPKSKIMAIRHVMRPTVSMNYRPDLSKNYFYTTQINKNGTIQQFSELQGGGIYSGYSGGKSGGMSFQLDNNIEMAVRDTTNEKGKRNVRLIDGFGVSTFYNFLADSMKLQPFNVYFRANVLNKININVNGIVNPYEVDEMGRSIDKYAWSSGGFSPGRLSSGSLSMSTSFKSKAKDEAKEEEKQNELDAFLNDPVLAADRDRLMEYMRQNPAEFVDFNIPWQVSLSVSMNLSERWKADYSGFEKIFSASTNFSGSFSLTPKWNISGNGFYDMKNQKLQSLSFAISREMHCWQMSLNVSPIGMYRFFNITISPKSGILQDLRINRTRSFYTPF